MEKSLGQRALELAITELGTEEVPLGSNTGPRVRQYLYQCERDGKLLGLASGNWCASFACWSEYNVAISPEIPCHGYRASVAELWQDAKTYDCAMSLEYVPQPGDLAIFKRDGMNPLLGGEGHIGRVEISPNEKGEFQTIDGNHNNRVSRVLRKINDGDLVGWINCQTNIVVKISDTDQTDNSNIS